jgi:hypothetical protein
MPRYTDDLVTVVGSAYFQPIADLIERLVNRKPHRPNRVKSDHQENGYSAASVILLVAMFESYMSRVRFVKSSRVTSKVQSALDVVLSVFPRLRHRLALQEVYVPRDLLMHSHLWEIEYECGGPVPMVLKKATLHPGYGDKKFHARVDMRTYRTKAIGLSVFPLRVDRRDVLKVFETIWKTLERFQKQDMNQVSVSQLRVRFHGKIVEFGSLRNEIQNAL